MLGVFVLISLFAFSFRFSLGVLLGGLISIVNFHWLGRDLKKVFQSLNDNSKTRIMFKYYIRFAITAVVLYFVVSENTVDIIGLLIGLSVVLINIVLTTVITLTKKNCLEEVK